MIHGVLEFVSSPPTRGRLDIDYGKPHQWFGRWMRIKGPRNHMITGLGSCVEVALRSEHLKPRHRPHNIIKQYCCQDIDKHTSVKCHVLTLMVKLLIVSVTRT